MYLIKSGHIMTPWLLHPDQDVFCLCQTLSFMTCDYLQLDSPKHMKNNYFDHDQFNWQE